MDDRVAYKQRRSKVAQQLRQRLVAHIAAGGTTDMAPSTMENSSSAYCDPLLAQQEKSRLFHETPIVACFTSELAKPGDCFVFNLCGTSVILLRGQDSKLRGFFNRCSHRGSRLIATEAGPARVNATRIVCPFHAWCFDFEGKLTHIPGADGFEAQQLQQRGLSPIAVLEHLGLVFVQLLGSVAQADLDRHLGAFREEVAQLELDQLQRIQSYSLKANCNWKFAMDTYCEGYHFGMLHRKSIGAAYYSNMATFDDYFPHWRLCFAERGLASLIHQDESQWPFPKFSGTHYLFPNTLLVAGTLTGGEMCVRMFQLFPGREPSEMTCAITVYAPQSVLEDKERVAREFAYNDATSDITREDYQIAVEGYKNLANAPRPFQLTYGKNEPGVQAFHRALAKALASERC